MFSVAEKGRRTGHGIVAAKLMSLQRTIPALACILILAAVFSQPIWARALAVACLVGIGISPARFMRAAWGGGGSVAWKSATYNTRFPLDCLQQSALSIFHDLRTPIMRLKLRAELLDDESLRKDLHEDIDDLDLMVKEALQSFNGGDFHENRTEVKLESLIEGLARGARLLGREVAFSGTSLHVMAEPLALKRALGNLLDNALHYGGKAEISVTSTESRIVIQIRDHGPGIPAAALLSLRRPFIRLHHGKSKNTEGLGLGLSIARDIIRSLGGRLKLSNHPQGGLVAAISLPAMRPGHPDVGRLLSTRACR